MKPTAPTARQFHRAAMMALEHARHHAMVSGELDAAQVVLSLDYALEMLLKAVLLERDQSIMDRPGRSIGLLEALRRSGPYKQASTAEVLRVYRDGLQHFAQYTDPATTVDLYEGTLRLAGEILIRDFGQTLPHGLRVSQEVKIPKISGLSLLSPAKELQRDIAAVGTLACWSQGVAGSTRLEVWMKRSGSEALRLTPDGEFEYMPKTDGENIVAYRQSGGIVLYTLSTNAREVVSQTGGPTSIRGEWIAAQGLGIQEGLGGGIWLYRRATAEWQQVSESGDSARLTDDNVVWQELDGNELTIKVQNLKDGTSRTLIRGGKHPSVWLDRIAWTDWPGGAESRVHVTDLAGERVWTGGPGIFPSLAGDHVAFLAPSGDGYRLVVQDVTEDKPVLEIPSVAFPLGGGPTLTEGALLFESEADGSVHGIWIAQLERLL
jgi:hypothetical protein